MVRYRDKAGRVGVQQVQVKAGKLLVVGKGPSLTPPSIPLHADPVVTVQLHDDTGGCWQSSFTSASVNAGGLYKAVNQP